MSKVSLQISKLFRTALKTPAAYHGQRRQLERAKTGDMLKAKIQQRPPRQELERRHILESDPGHLDPSLAEKQRMLKKARLADQLNDQLSHRPGPLELIQKNILHTEEPIENAVKSGKIPYKATCEGQLNRPQHPNSYITPEDDSQSSEDNLVSPGPSDVLETAAKSAGIVVSLIPTTEVTTSTSVFSKENNGEIVFAPLIHQSTAPSPAASLVSSTSTLSPLSSIASPVPSIVSQPATPIPPPLPTFTPRPLQSPKTDAPGKDKNRKKSKSKATPKTRTIKFHEYKGPPNAPKSLPSISSSGESSYDLLLQQQTLLLKFQLQLQHKYPQIILPASQKGSPPCENSCSQSNQQPSPASSTASSSESSMAPRSVGRLEDMKVSDLKMELKRRNLPVSGSKPQLIERLKSFTSNAGVETHQHVMSEAKAITEDVHGSPHHNELGSPQNSVEDTSEFMDIADPISPQPASIISQESQSMKSQEEIVREQQRQIEELQRELTLSQLKLQAATRAEPKAQLLALQKHLQARQQQQQLLRLKAIKAKQEEELQQQQHVAFQNQKNLAGGLFFNAADATLVLNHFMLQNKKFMNGHNRAPSLPTFLNSLVTPVIATPEIVKTEYNDDVKPPPLYEEATKQMKKEKNNVKSQIVDDVLEILIKNGELPPSAAHDPSTPGSAGTRNSELIFPNPSLRPVDDNAADSVLNLDSADFLNTPLDMDIGQLVMELGGQQMEDGMSRNDNMDRVSPVVPMDTDDEWLESLLPTNDHHDVVSPSASQNSVTAEPSLGGYDPLMAIAQDPFDPFCLEDFRSTPLSWDYPT